jgi:hypothetical protein
MNTREEPKVAHGVAHGVGHSNSHGTSSLAPGHITAPGKCRGRGCKLRVRHGHSDIAHKERACGRPPQHCVKAT